jgi:hypothetical protein
MTKKRKILFLIPFCIVTLMLVYSWFIYLLWGHGFFIRHYLALFLYVPLLYFLFKEKSYKKILVCLGIYLLLATFNFIILLPDIESNWYGIKIATVEIRTPPFNFKIFLLFILYIILNFDSLTDIYLDYKESKKKL